MFSLTKKVTRKKIEENKERGRELLVWEKRQTNELAIDNQM